MLICGLLALFTIMVLLSTTAARPPVVAMLAAMLTEIKAAVAAHTGHIVPSFSATMS
jgi:hypothetical protein